MIENISKVKVAERLSLDVRSFGTFKFLYTNQILMSYQHKHVYIVCREIKNRIKNEGRH
jgi:hypothetical protein